MLYNVSQEDDILIVSEAKHETGNFDTMRVFVPMITHLLRVAQANMGNSNSQFKFQVKKNTHAFLQTSKVCFLWYWVDYA